MTLHATRTATLRTALALVASLFLHGCDATLPERTGGSDGRWLAERIQLAERQEKRGDIAGALFHWQVARALAPGDRQIAQQIERLEQARSDQARSLEAAGKRELGRGQVRKGRNALLRALALNPGDPGALEALRGLERRRLERQMVAKVGRSREALAVAHRSNGNASDEERVYIANERRASAGPVRKDSGKAVLNRHLDRADRYFRKGHYDGALQEIRKAKRIAGGNRALVERVSYRSREYADWLYGSGLRLAASDPGQALELWRLALLFEPGHAKAEARIRRFTPR